MKENANKASSILLTAIPQISQMDWAQTMKTLKVSCQLYDESFPSSLWRSCERGSVYLSVGLIKPSAVWLLSKHSLVYKSIYYKIFYNEVEVAEVTLKVFYTTCRSYWWYNHLEEFGSSVFCPRALKHASHRSWGSNQRPALPPEPQEQTMSFTSIYEVSADIIVMWLCIEKMLWCDATWLNVMRDLHQKCWTCLKYIEVAVR